MLPASEFTGATTGLADTLKTAAMVAGQQGLVDALNGYEQALIANTPANIVIQKGEQLDYVLNAVVPLIVPYAYPALQAAHRNEDAGRASFSVTDAQVLYSTAQAYYACAGADELVEARRHAVDGRARRRSTTRARASRPAWSIASR